MQISADFPEHVRHSLWLHRKYHDVGPRDRLTIIRSNANRKLGFQSIATGGHRISGPEQLRATDLSCEHAADDRFRHLPTPDERDFVG
jgi:hypothetical protein